MNKDERKVPELRFKDFHDDWEQRKLGELSEITKLAGFEFTKHIVYSNQGEIPAIRGLNVKNGAFDFSDLKYIDNSEFSKLSRSKLLNQDIVFTYIGTIGEAAIVPKGVNWYLAPNVARIRSISIEPGYLFQTLISPIYKNQEIRKWITSSSQPALSMENIRKFNIIYPRYSEQIKIGQFLKNIDRLITLHQRKINILKEQQKAYLRIIFPSKNKNAPKLRFISYTEKWNEYKLGELMEIGSVKRIHKSDWKEKGIRFLRARDIVSFFKNEEPAEKLYISRDTFENYSKTTGKVSPGDLLVTGVGSIGVPLLIKDLKPLYFKDGNIIWFKNQTLDGYYFYYYFVSDNIQRFISNVAGIGTVGTYTISNGKKTPIKFPSMVEQKLIGHFLFKIEKNLLLNERKVKALNKLKELYLRKMFL